VSRELQWSSLEPTMLQSTVLATSKRQQLPNMTERSNVAIVLILHKLVTLSALNNPVKFRSSVTPRHLMVDEVLTAALLET